MTYGTLSWIYVERPTETESELLARRYGLDRVHLAEALSRRPALRRAQGDTYDYIVVGTPSQNRLTRATTSIAASVFVGGDFVITVHHGDARPLVRLFRDCESDELRQAETMRAGPLGLTLAIIERMSDPALQVVESFGSQLQQIGDSLAAGDDRELVQEIVYLERDIAAFGGIIRSTWLSLGTLVRRRERLGLSRGEPARGLDLLVERVERALDLLSLAGTEASSLTRAGGLLAAQRTVGAARLAAGLLAMLLPTIVLAGLFAANIKDIPLADYPYAFEVLLGLAIAVALVVLWLLRRRRWV